jgi:hypothetical protein
MKYQDSAIWDFLTNLIIFSNSKNHAMALQEETFSEITSFWFDK